MLKKVMNFGKINFKKIFFLKKAVSKLFDILMPLASCQSSCWAKYSSDTFMRLIQHA